MTTIKSLTTDHPELGQIIHVRAPRRSDALLVLRGGKDVFVHATALARAGLSGLAEGQRVRMRVGQGQKGLERFTF